MCCTTSWLGKLPPLNYFVLSPTSYGRKAWEDISGKICESFKVSEFAQKLSEEVLRKAKSLHDIMMGAPTQGKGQGKRVADTSVGQPPFKKVR